MEAPHIRLKRSHFHKGGLESREWHEVTSQGPVVLRTRGWISANVFPSAGPTLKPHVGLLRSLHTSRQGMPHTRRPGMLPCDVCVMRVRTCCTSAFRMEHCRRALLAHPNSKARVTVRPSVLSPHIIVKSISIYPVPVMEGGILASENESLPFMGNNDGGQSSSHLHQPPHSNDQRYTTRIFPFPGLPPKRAPVPQMRLSADIQDKRVT